MTAQSDKSPDNLITRVLTTLRGGTAPVLPQRVREDVARQQDRSEQIISVVQIVIVLLFGGLFLIAPGVLAAAVLRARQMLFTAVSEGSAKRDLSRFFDTYVADRITGREHELRAGEGQHRTAAVVFFDIRGFIGLSDRLDAGGLVQLLSEYQSRMVPIVQDNGGVIDKFLGDVWCGGGEPDLRRRRAAGYRGGGRCN